jgi:hypothetical protein
MAGTVVMIVVLALFPVVLLMSGAAASALVGWLLKKDRDDAYAGTEYLELSEANPYRGD